MIKVTQTVTDSGAGNCMQATIASLFEKNLQDVPNFVEYGLTEWQRKLFEYLGSVGYDYEGMLEPLETKEGTLARLKNTPLVNGFIYAVVPSLNFKDKTHAVVIDMTGVVVNDPHPEKKYEGVNVVETGGLLYWYMIKKVARREVA